MKNVENMPEEKDNKIDHDLKIALNNIFKLCEKNNVPFFMVYYTKENGYCYKGLFPEEIEDGSLSSQYGRFPKFFETVVGFNKEDFKPTIMANKKE